LKLIHLRYLGASCDGNVVWRKCVERLSTKVRAENLHAAASNRFRTNSPVNELPQMMSNASMPNHLRHGVQGSTGDRRVACGAGCPRDKRIEVPSGGRREGNDEKRHDKKVADADGGADVAPWSQSKEVVRRENVACFPSAN
jgi:hypothetical protein